MSQKKMASPAKSVAKKRVRDEDIWRLEYYIIGTYENLSRSNGRPTAGIISLDKTIANTLKVSLRTVKRALANKIMIGKRLTRHMKGGGSPEARERAFFQAYILPGLDKKRRDDYMRSMLAIIKDGESFVASQQVGDPRLEHGR